MNTLHRTASHAKRHQPMFAISMLQQSIKPESFELRLRAGPAPTDPIKAVPWDTKVLDGLQDQPEENYHSIMAMVRTALERLKSGDGTVKDFNRVGSAFNVALVRAESIDFRAVEVMQAGVAALVECDRLQQRHRRYGFTGPGLLAVGDAMNLYEDILRLSPPVLMEAAVMEVAKRMLAQAQGGAS